MISNRGGEAYHKPVFSAKNTKGLFKFTPKGPDTARGIEVMKSVFWQQREKEVLETMSAERHNRSVDSRIVLKD